RPAEQEALAVVAPVVVQEGKLGIVLDAFGENFDPEAARQPDDGAHDRRVVVVRGDVPNERLVDLERIQRQTLEVAQARVTRAEVVDRNGNAARLQTLER